MATVCFPDLLLPHKSILCRGIVAVLRAQIERERERVWMVYQQQSNLVFWSHFPLILLLCAPYILIVPKMIYGWHWHTHTQSPRGERDKEREEGMEENSLLVSKFPTIFLQNDVNAAAACSLLCCV